MREEQGIDQITQVFERESAQLRRRTFWLSLIPIVIGAVVIVTTYYGLREARARKAMLETQVGKLEAYLEELEAKRERLIDEANQQKAVAEHLQQKLPAPERQAAELIQSGLAAFNRGDYELAAEQLEAAAARDPNLAEVRYRLGMSLWQTGKEKAAVEQMSKAFELDESYEKRAKEDPRLQELRAYGEIVAAEKPEAVKTAVEEDETEYIKEALASSRAGSLDEAVESYGKALDVNPANAKVLGLRGATLLRKGDYDGAIESLRSCLELDAEAADCRYALGLALWQRGDRKAARAAFDKAFELDPSIKSRAQNDPAYRRVLIDGRAFEAKVEPGSSRKKKG